MKILVTGATGFLGSNLCARLERDGHAVTRLDSKAADLTRQGTLSPWDSISFDRIIHLATWTQAGDFCLYHPGEQWKINQQINTNVLEWWHARQPQAKMISIGTSCSYDPGLPLVETNYLAGIPIDSLFTYAMTKRMLYTGHLALAKQFGLRYLHVVPSTLYGGGYHADGRQLHFIFDLIRKIMRGKRRGEPVVLWGHGHQRRELVLVDDFAEMLLRLDGLVENELINLGAGEDYSIREFAAAICRQADYDPELIQYDTTRHVGAESKFLDVAKLRRLLPDFVPTSLEEGLRRSIEWMAGTDMV